MDNIDTLLDENTRLMIKLSTYLLAKAEREVTIEVAERFISCAVALRQTVEACLIEAT